MTPVYEEYKESIHYKNAAGVRAICSDCHVPREWLPKMVRKVHATNKLYHKIAGGTCIECHKGTAHKLPEGYDDDDD